MPKWIKFFLVFMITLILVTPFSSSTARPLYASSATYPYYVGTSSAKAGSYATWVIEGQHRMKCTHSSWTSPATTINVLGFYWVACTVKCRAPNGTETIYSQNTWNPGYITGSSNTKGDLLYSYCADGYTTIWVSQSWHDFNHTGSPIWRPTTDYYFSY